MRHLKAGFLWPFAGGFVLGAIGLVLLHSPERADALVGRLAPIHHLR